MFRVSLFRSHARTIALFLLLTGVAGYQHAGKDDFGCGPLGGSPSSADSVGAAPADAPEHCVVCHWMRSLRSSSALTPPVHSAPASAGDVDVLPDVAHRAPALDRSPARAPPLSL